LSVHPGAESIVIERLNPADLADAFAVLEDDPVLNVYPIAVMLRDALTPSRDEFWAARRNGAIQAMMMVGTGSGSLLPLGTDALALERLAGHALERRAALQRRFQLIGTRAAIAPFLARFEAAGLTPRLSRSQIYMAVERGRLADIEPLPELRPARAEDYALIYESGARLRAEELEEDPRTSDPASYARRAEEECRDGFTLLWRTEGQLRFRASVSARTGDAAQISGVYTPPEWRGRGIATRGVAQLCRRLFEHSRAACLFVNDFNLPALAVYRRLGFAALSDWGSAFYDRPS
jgi:uncharacterized protein